MANTLYENFVLESKLTDLLSTKLNARNYMTIDTSLTQSAGLKKVINVYNYTGAVESLALGAKNTTRGAISFTPVEYLVGVKQQVFDYFDEQFMQDPTVLDMGMNGASTVMTNDLVADFFTELAKATLGQTYPKDGAIAYDTIVDSIAKMELEDENGLFVIIGTDLKAQIRKDADFVASRQGEILYSGQIGSICGVPVVVSKAIDAGVAYVADKTAVTLFTKKDSEIEQVRDAETRTNTVVMRKVGVVALTDATKVVKITEALA